MLTKADQLATEVVRMRNELAHLKTQAERSEVNEQLSAKTKQYWDIENMPTWPVDISTVRRFTLRNITLLLPVVAQSTGLREVWVKALKGVAGEIGK